MPYCTIANLTDDQLPEADLIQLTDDEGLGEVHAGRVDKAINAAANLIDGYLRGRYTLPLDTVPALISDIAIALTVYKLYKRKKKEAMPESMEKDYAANIKILEGIQKGTIILPIDQASGGSGEVSGSGNFRTNKTAADREFSKDKLSGY